MLNAMRHSHCPSPLRLLSPFAAKQTPLGDEGKIRLFDSSRVLQLFLILQPPTLSKMPGAQNKPRRSGVNVSVAEIN
jgi:hypothetical protein